MVDGIRGSTTPSVRQPETAENSAPTSAPGEIADVPPTDVGQTSEGAPVTDGYDGKSGTASVAGMSAEMSLEDFPPIDASLKDEVSALRAAHHAGRGARAHAHEDHRHYGPGGAKGKPVVIAGSGGNDVISVKNASDGGLDVDVNGKRQHVKKADADRLVIRAGGGDDSVTIDERVKRSIRVEGGEGSDTLRGGGGNDVLVGGGSGKNTIDGRGGHDTLVGGLGDDQLSGGSGRDILKGIDGADVLDGGADDDYLDGGKGADGLRGQGGRDTLVGGDGNDTLQGADGADVLSGGRGVDKLDGGGEKDRFYAQPGDKGAIDKAAGEGASKVDMAEKEGDTRPGHRLKIEGPPEYVAQVEADLEAMRSTPIGRELLQQLDADVAAKKLPDVTISPLKAGDDGAKTVSDSRYRVRGDDGKPGAGTAAAVRYDPTETSTLGARDGWKHTPSSVTLFHELVHAHRAMTGDEVQGEMHQGGGGGFAHNEERRTVGLQHHERDFADNPGRLLSPDDKLNENTFRRQLGLPVRDRY